MNTNNLTAFSFKPVVESDLPLLYSWFKKAHVDQWWPVSADKEDFFQSFLERIRLGIKKPYLVFYAGEPIGYIQSYTVDQSTHSWLPEISKYTKIIGIDQFIGEEGLLYKGLGPCFIKAFIDDVLLGAGYHKVLVDPDPSNSAAIRCYEKVGFESLGQYQAPWGPAQVMIYSI